MNSVYNFFFTVALVYLFIVLTDTSLHLTKVITGEFLIDVYFPKFSTFPAFMTFKQLFNTVSLTFFK